MQMVSEQDSEDEKLQWKVDAEVHAATRAAEAAREAAEAASKSLRQELEQQREQMAALEANLTAWESAVAERDLEIVNLQVWSPLHLSVSLRLMFDNPEQSASAMPGIANGVAVSGRLQMMLS